MEFEGVPDGFTLSRFGCFWAPEFLFSRRHPSPADQIGRAQSSSGSDVSRHRCTVSECVALYQITTPSRMLASECIEKNAAQAFRPDFICTAYCMCGAGKAPKGMVRNHLFFSRCHRPSQGRHALKRSATNRYPGGEKRVSPKKTKKPRSVN